MAKIRLWTTQDIRSLKQIEENGTYRVSREAIQNKYTDCSDVYFKVYSWFSKTAGKYLKKPEGAEFPVWAALKKEETHGLIEGTVRYELEADEEDVLIFDTGKWDYILNYWYIPENEEDRKSYREELERYGIENQSRIMMTNFYPELKRKLENSWERLFDSKITVSEINQAAMWEIRKEWIKGIELFKRPDSDNNKK